MTRPIGARPIGTLSSEQCRARLAAHSVGRVAVTRDALPVIVPVNYLVDGDRILFRTRDDGMLAAACDERVVAFEIDDVAPDGASGWSVVVVGLASLVDREGCRDLDRRLASAAGLGLDRFIRLPMTIVTGREIPSPAALAATG
jgi:uncharacterized protein